MCFVLDPFNLKTHDFRSVNFSFLFIKYILKKLFTYFWLHWVFIAALGLSLLMVSRGYPSCTVLVSHCSGFSCFGACFRACRLQLLQLVGSSAGSVFVVHGLSCLTACVIFLDQGLNLCSLHWQVDS